MILDTWQNLSRYVALHRLIPDVVERVATTDLNVLPCGRHEFCGEELFAAVAREPGKQADAAPLEVHRKYIDIQIILAGVDAMGWKPLANCRVPQTSYDEDRDIAFFGDAPDTWLSVQPGQFVMFFPEDAHAPMVSDDIIHKVVFKLAL